MSASSMMLEVRSSYAEDTWASYQPDLLVINKDKSVY